ncbi:MAG: hypothetical protein CK431_21310 [Mycobacterium sp.]|nr:MAG: hypothetical protein CK431_21310 [Mycobacterium sp.]
MDPRLQAAIEQINNACTKAQVAQLCGVSEQTVYDWIKAGKLPVIRIGSPKFAIVRVLREDIPPELLAS